MTTGTVGIDLPTQEKEIAKLQAENARLARELDAAKQKRDEYKSWFEEYKTEYGNLEDELDELDRKRQAAEAELAALKQQVETLKRGLEFYADTETYFAIGIFADPPCGGFAYDFDDDGYGLKARQALAALKENTDD